MKYLKEDTPPKDYSPRENARVYGVFQVCLTENI